MFFFYIYTYPGVYLNVPSFLFLGKLMNEADEVGIGGVVEYYSIM